MWYTVDIIIQPTHHMKNHAVVTAVVLFALIVVGMFVYAFLKKSELQEGEEPSVVTTPTAGPYDHITRIDAKHFFIDGKHTLTGEIMMPTPCDLINWDASVAESMPEQATVMFDVVNNAETCAQVLTPQRFSVDFVASEKAIIRATLEGREVELNLIPAAEGESPEDFELYIKG